MKKLTLAVAIAVGVSTLTGCMGQMEGTKTITKVNLKAVDNRYARAGLFVLMSPIYAIASVGDLFIFNTIEFWSGTNPISGKSPALADTPANALLKVNDDVNESLSSAPQANIELDKNIKKTQLSQIDENTMQMDISYVDGSQKTLRGVKSGDAVDFYLNDELITTVKVTELEAYVTQAQS